MARNTKRGKCELCGEVANVGTNHGSATCTKCTHVQAALANRLQAVAKAARAMGKAEDLIKALIPDGGSLAVQVTATLLQEISGIVGYEGENPAELVEAVRRRALTCASCEAEDVLAEIREIVGYAPEQGDKGLADAVRAFEDAGRVDCAECEAANAMIVIAELVGKPGADPDSVKAAVRGLVAAGGKDCTNDEILLRDDLARACDMDQDYSHSLSTVVQNAIHELARLTNRKNFWIEAATELKAEVVELNKQLGILRVELTLAQQARGEWEQRAVQAEQNVETLEAELRNWESSPVPCTDNTLLDIALKALRGEGPDAEQLAALIDAARRVA